MICPVCQEDFTPKSVLAVYCGTVCRQRAYRGRVALILKKARVDKGLKFPVIKEVVISEVKDEAAKLPNESGIDYAIRKAGMSSLLP